MTLRLQDTELRCPNPEFQGKPCRMKWAKEVTRPWTFTCRRCKKTYRAEVETGEGDGT